MDKKLFKEAITKVTAGMILIGLLLFLPAGTIKYPNGWLFMAILFIPMVIAGFVMMAKSPELLRKRLKAKEEQGQQRKVIAASALMFLVGFILCGLDFRFKLTLLPKPVVIAGAVIFLFSYAVYAEVLRENAYLSRVIEVQEGQKVIDTGLYGIVRHPMYSAVIFLFTSMPIVLGSFIGFIVFLIFPYIIVKRIENEEEVLEEGLAGYKEYKEKVKYRLIPFIW